MLRKLYHLEHAKPFIIDDMLLWYRGVDGMYAQVVEHPMYLEDSTKWCFFACWHECIPLRMIAFGGVYVD